jgi:ubiquilin
LQCKSCIINNNSSNLVLSCIFSCYTLLRPPGLPVAPATGPTGSTATAHESNPAAANPFAALFGAGAGLGTNPAADPAQTYASQLAQLADMGFTNRDQNIRALQATFGNVHAAVERILNGLI